MYNRVIMLGNLTRDIELRYTQNGMAIAKSAIATNRRYKTQTGEQKEETCFIDITLFGRAAEIANQYLKKGRKILIEGRLVFEQWVDQSGQKRSKHSIAVDNLQMIDRGETPSNYQPQNSYQQNSKPTQDYQAPSVKEEIPEIDIEDDEIPF
ncbi:single-stranded DNA-binding protein [Nitrosophilus kaiyonis]|uniref:single-stranded DNA-binding protein n=1 Tax=Nitrosophilus kaiyonis TaxID=2930200 RepID=UPI0024930064|nr:single-stranded DNA-binding protein [Nitrosophilus kaiyonis]